MLVGRAHLRLNKLRLPSVDAKNSEMVRTPNRSRNFSHTSGRMPLPSGSSQHRDGSRSRTGHADAMLFVVLRRRHGEQIAANLADVLHHGRIGGADLRGSARAQLASTNLVPELGGAKLATDGNGTATLPGREDGEEERGRVVERHWRVDPASVSPLNATWTHVSLAVNELMAGQMRCAMPTRPWAQTAAFGRPVVPDV